MANYLQCTVVDKVYLVAKTVTNGKAQLIALPSLIDTKALDIVNKDLQEEAIRAIAKRKAKLDNTLKKGFAMVFDQCSLELQD